MHPELEALVKAFDAFIQTQGGPDAQNLFSAYGVKLKDAATTMRITRLATPAKDSVARKTDLRGHNRQQPVGRR